MIRLLEDIERWAAATRQPEYAIQLVSFAEVQRDEMSFSVPPVLREPAGQLLVELRDSLGDRFDPARSAGRGISLDAAIERAHSCLRSYSGKT